MTPLLLLDLSYDRAAIFRDAHRRRREAAREGVALPLAWCLRDAYGLARTQQALLSARRLRSSYPTRSAFLADIGAVPTKKGAA